MNASTGIVLALVIAAFVAVVVKWIRDKRQGKSSCSCGCGGCALKDSCHAPKEK